MLINKNFDEKDQKTLIELLCSDGTVFSRVLPILKAEYFNKKFQPTINYLIDFSNKYNTLPSFTQLNNEARIEYNVVNGISSNINLQKSALDLAEGFIKKRALEIAVEQAYSLIAKGETSGIDTIIKEAQSISLQQDLGMNFWEKPDEWLQQQETDQALLPTGWKTFDERLGGGLAYGELEYVIGASGGGKSLTMQNMAVNWSCQGYNVIYFTLEMNRRLVGKRMASMTSNVPYRDIRGNISGVASTIIAKRKNITPGILQVADLPIGCNANLIESFIQEFELKTNIIPQIIFVDYADIMTPCDKRIDPNSISRVDKAITLELREIARERTRNGKNTTIITASQLTKEAMDEVDCGMSNIGGGQYKSSNSDNIFLVKTTDALRQKGEYEFKFLKTRNSGAKDTKLRMKYNVDTLLISDLDEVQSATPVFNTNQQVSNALATLRGLTQKSN
jgi:hypothetical protein